MTSLTRSRGPGVPRTPALDPFQVALAEEAARLAQSRPDLQLEAPRRPGELHTARSRARARAARRPIARAVARYGLHVRCQECGARAQVRTSGDQRLRHVGCSECGGRLRPLSWRGFDARP